MEDAKEWHDLVADAKELLLQLRSDEHNAHRLADCRRTLLHLYEAYMLDASASADDAYAQNLQSFVDSVLAFTSSKTAHTTDEDGTEDRAAATTATTYDAGDEACDAVLAEYASIDPDIVVVNVVVVDSEEEEAARPPSDAHAARGMEEVELEEVEAEAVAPQLAKKKKRKRKRSSFAPKKKGARKGKEYVPVPEDQRKRKKSQPKNVSPLSEEDLDPLAGLDLLQYSQEDQRRLISLFYLQVLQAPPPEEWHGEGGTVSQIVKALKMTKDQRRKVFRVIAKTHHCLTVGEPYDAGRAHRPGTTSIKDKSKEQQLVADYRERGLSLTETTMLINRWCVENDRPTVTRSAVDTCEQLMVKEVSRIDKRPQGDKDVDSVWAKTRFRWVAQLLIRLGHHDAVDHNDLLDDDGEFPNCFDPSLLPELKLEAIAWWDEVHKDCFIGDFREGQKEQRRFPRDKDGNYDPENGELREKKTALQVKYAKQVRFCFGVAMTGEEGSEEGRRMAVFDYTQRKVIGIKEREKKVADEIRRVKGLSRTDRHWISHPRGEGDLYLDDPVSAVPGVGTVAERLLHQNDLYIVQDLVGLQGDDAAIKSIVKKTKGLGLASLRKFLDSCSAVIPENAPDVEYYIDQPNPYAAKYGTEKDEWGEEAWLTEMKKSSAFSGVACITDLVKHIVVETKKCFADTEHKDTYFFYHDALTQLTHECCVDWMRNTIIPGEEKCIYDRWVKPELGLNDAFGSKWWRRPIGNSPELMPLDNHLNNDVHESVRRHVIMSLTAQGIGRNDPRLFSMATPKHGASAYKRVFDPVDGVSPPSERIVQDVKKVVHALKEIYKAKGAYVPGLAGGRTAGKRHTATGEKKKRGGKRERLEYSRALDEKEMHPDLVAVLADSQDLTAFFRRPDEPEDADEQP